MCDITVLMRKYGVKVCEDAEVILGMRVTRNRAQCTLTIDQEQYVKRLLEKFRMEESTAVTTPEIDYTSKEAQRTIVSIQAQQFSCKRV